MTKYQSHQWRDPVYNELERHYNLFLTINCNTLIHDKMYRVENVEYNRPNQFTVMLG